MWPVSACSCEAACRLPHKEVWLLQTQRGFCLWLHWKTGWGRAQGEHLRHCCVSAAPVGYIVVWVLPLLVTLSCECCSCWFVHCCVNAAPVGYSVLWVLLVLVTLLCECCSCWVVHCRVSAAPVGCWAGFVPCCVLKNHSFTEIINHAGTVIRSPLSALESRSPAYGYHSLCIR